VVDYLPYISGVGSSDSNFTVTLAFYNSSVLRELDPAVAFSLGTFYEASIVNTTSNITYNLTFISMNASYLLFQINFARNTILNVSETFCLLSRALNS